MKRKIACACVACVLLLFGVAKLRIEEEKENPAMPQAAIEQIHLPEPSFSASATADAEEEEPEGGGYYVLKSYMDRLAVYRVYPDGTRALADIIDMDINTLPAQDVRSLQEGIVVRNNDALIRILEDFMS